MSMDIERWTIFKHVSADLRPHGIDIGPVTTEIVKTDCKSFPCEIYVKEDGPIRSIVLGRAAIEAIVKAFT